MTVSGRTRERRYRQEDGRKIEATTVPPRLQPTSPRHYENPVFLETVRAGFRWQPHNMKISRLDWR